MQSPPARQFTIGGLFVSTLSLLSAGCPSGTCTKPNQATNCATKCTNAATCAACCAAKFVVPGPGRDGCNNGCAVSHPANLTDDPRYDILEEELTSESCDCETDAAECNSELTTKIFANLPAFFDTLEARYVVCSLSEDDRAMLYDDISNNQDRIADIDATEYSAFINSLQDIYYYDENNERVSDNQYLFRVRCCFLTAWYEFMTAP